MQPPLTSVSVQLPPTSRVCVSASWAAGMSCRPASIVLHGDGSGEATLLGRRMIPNKAHPLPPFSVIATHGGANVTVTGEGTVLAEAGVSPTAPPCDVLVSSLCASDGNLVSIHEVLRAARRRYALGLAAKMGGAANSYQSQQPSSSSSSLPCAMVVGKKGSGKSTLVRQLSNMFLEDLRAGHGLFEGASEAGATSVLSIVHGDISSGGGGGGAALPGAISCEYVGQELVQPLAYFCGATDLGADGAVDRYLDVATYLSQGLEVLRMEAIGRSADDMTAAAAAAKQSSEEKDPRKEANASPPPTSMSSSAGILIDTIGLRGDAEGADSPSSSLPPDPAFGVVREVSDIFKATIVIAVGSTRAEANALADRLKSSVSALRLVEIMTYVPPSPSPTFTSLSAKVVDSTPLRHRLRIERPITEYFAGTFHNPLAAHLQVFSANELIFLDAVRFTVVQPTAALQGTLAAVPFRTPMHVIDAASVSGFVIIKEAGSESISMLCPCKGKLPSSVILVTSIVAPPTIMASVVF